MYWPRRADIPTIPAPPRRTPHHGTSPTPATRPKPSACSGFRPATTGGGSVDASLAGHRSQRGDDRGGCRGSPDLDIDRDHIADRAGHAVGVFEHPAVRAQSPTAITTRGPARRQRCRSGSAMFRVTTPVTSSASACRGEATSRAPYCSRRRPGRTRRDLHLAPVARTGVDMPDLQRTPHARRRFRRRLGAAPARSTTRPTRKILRIQPMRRVRQRPTRRSSSTATRSLSTLVSPCAPPPAARRYPARRSNRSPCCRPCARPRHRPAAAPPAAGTGSTTRVPPRVAAHRPIRSWSATSSRIRIRAGCPSVLKNSPLSLYSGSDST